MKNFAARTNGINMKIDGDMVAANRATLKPGVPMLMDTDGELILLGNTNVVIGNKHKVYFCNSWADSVSASGNDMISAIPLTKQFEFDIEFEANDAALTASIDLTVGDLLSLVSGDYKEAASTELVIGSVKSGGATKTAGGTLTITTIGADYVKP